MSILHLLSAGNYIVVNRSLINVFGLEAAVMLGELASEYVYWDDRGSTEDGWFFSTVENVEQNTGLSAYVQRTALNKLCEAGLAEVKKCGMPAKRYILINGDAVVKYFDDKLLKNLTTSEQDFSRQVVPNFNGNNNKPKTIKNNNIGNKVKFPDNVLKADPVIANNEELYTAFLDFMCMRKFIKHPIDEGGLRRIVSKVYKLGNGDAETMTAILDQSIENSWRGVFPLHNTQQKAPAQTGNEFDALLNGEADI